MGQKEQAVYWLEKANEKEVGDLIAVGQSPHFATLRNDDRFEALVKQVRVPDEMSH